MNVYDPILNIKLRTLLMSLCLLFYDTLIFMYLSYEHGNYYNLKKLKSYAQREKTNGALIITDNKCFRYQKSKCWTQYKIEFTL